MSLTLIAEDGSGVANANSYATVAQADAYHDGHLYASAWTAAVTATKEKALVMATRLIDAGVMWKGYKTNAGQALQWPRGIAKDDNLYGYPYAGFTGSESGGYFANDAIPKELVDAVSEQARLLISKDRTAEPDGRGIKRFDLKDVVAVEYDKGDRLPALADSVAAFLFNLGTVIKSGGVHMARVVR